jgi:cyanate lyase
MKFLHGEPPTWITFAKLRAKADARARMVSMEFALQLDEINTLKMPRFVTGAYNSMRSADSGVFRADIDRTIESQNLYFSTFIEDEKIIFEIEDVELHDLRLEKNPANRKVYLFFTITQVIGAELWDWAGRGLGTELAIRFEECQGELALKGKAAKA